MVGPLYCYNALICGCKMTELPQQQRESDEIHALRRRYLTRLGVLSNDRFGGGGKTVKEMRQSEAMLLGPSWNILEAMTDDPIKRHETRPTLIEQLMAQSTH